LSEIIHGGDVYRNKVNIDFSVSINPLGCPANVKSALEKAITEVEKYPDIECEILKDALSNMLGVKKENIIAGNGSSEIFLAIAHAINAKNALIVTPSFYGYEYAFSNHSENISYYELKEEKDFALSKDFLEVLNDDLDLLVIANPNNPTGKLIEKELLKNIIEVCKDKNIKVILDECFIEFAGEENSLINEIASYPNLCIVRSFTKIFAIPGVRIGYAVCSDVEFVNEVNKHLPEWNISAFANAAGIECTKCNDFVKESFEYVKEQRDYLSGELKKLGIKVFDSDCNFILIKGKRNLSDLLLEKGILIRNCSNFRSLSNEYYRISIKNQTENEKLISELASI